jgi:hypothetical protein
VVQKVKVEYGHANAEAKVVKGGWGEEENLDDAE